LTNCNPAPTPLAQGLKLKPVKNSENPFYRKLIASLMYLAVGTRPDISFAVGYLSQFNSCNGPEHLAAAKRIVRYLKGTANLGLCFSGEDGDLIAYADADYGSNSEDRSSFSGYMFKFGGGAVSWRSRKQNTLTLADSTTFAEYVSVSQCGKECMYLRSLLSELGFKLNPTVIFNEGAVKLTQSEICQDRSKHIDIKFHQIRRWVKRGVLKVIFKPDNEMYADVLTKPLFGPKHEFCVQGMNLC